MQKIIQKIFPLLFLLILAVQSNCQDLRINLKIADSLFEQKKYTQSLDIYKDLLNRYHRYTPQTLLKMAFIEDALGENAEALHYLNFYYEQFPNKKIMEKMKEIASKEKLEGYSYNDLEYFSSIYKKYYLEIIIGLAGFTFLYFMAVVANKIFIKGLSSTRPVFFILYCFLLLYFFHFGEKYIRRSKAVVSRSQALLMDAPSAGAKCIGSVVQGTRLTLLGKQDIWYKTENSQGKSVYIRESSFYNMP